MEQVAAIDFFVVPTATFRILFVFVVLSHARRRVLHFQVTTTLAWVPISSARPRCDLRR
jgi:hypothetical protein